MKKVLLILLSVVMLLSLIGCLPTRTSSEDDSSDVDATIIESKDDLTVEESKDTLTVEEAKEKLVGTWNYAYRYNSDIVGIGTGGFIFNSDGTYQETWHEYLPNAHIYQDESLTGWDVAPMGFPSDFGTYEIKEITDEYVTVILCCTNDGLEDLPTPEITELTIYDLESFSMKASEENKDKLTQYYKTDDFYTLCELLDVDTTI